MKRESLGELLIKLGRIDALQLRAALAHQKQWGTPLGKVLVQHRFCTWSDVLEALAAQTGLPTIDLDAVGLDLSLAQVLPEKLARKLGAVPLRLEGARGDVLHVAVVAPAGLDALDSLRSVTGKRVRASLAADDAIERAQHRLYGGDAPAETVSHVVPMNELSFELDAGVNEQHEVLLYGWDPETTRRLAELLKENGYVPKIASQSDVLLARSDDVLLSPLPVMEAMAVNGISVPAKLVAAGKRPEVDAARAFWLGARAFVAAPLDRNRVLTALRRLFDGVAVPTTAFAV